MRILLLVPKQFKRIEDAQTNGIDPFTQLPKFQAQNLWVKALKALGNEVQTIIYTGQNSQLDYYSFLAKNFFEKFTFIKSTLFLKMLPLVRRQDEIIKFSQNFKPQLVILSGNTDSVFPETLFQIKKISTCKLILLNGLSPVNFATKTERIMTPEFDYIFTNDAYHAIDWLMLGAKGATSLPVSAIDPEIHKIYNLTREERQEFSTDISFVGTLAPDQIFRDRIAILEALTDCDLKVWTYDRKVIKANKKLRKFYAGEASGVKMFKIFTASKINLNFHSHTMPAGGNLRTFEILGCGGFEIVDRVNSSWFKIGKEIVTFANIEDLKNKIKYYLKNKNEREQIANSGFARTHQDHTYHNRFLKLLEILNRV